MAKLYSETYPSLMQITYIDNINEVDGKIEYPIIPKESKFTGSCKLGIVICFNLGFMYIYMDLRPYMKSATMSYLAILWSNTILYYLS